MNAAFSQALVRGLGAHSPSGIVKSTDPVVHQLPFKPPIASSTAPHIVPQTHGDPNYYATSPKFDSSGYWHSAGSFPPYSTPKGDPVTPSQGEWIAQGTTTRNGLSTTFWVWYPPEDKAVILGKQDPGERNYLVSRTKLSDSAQPAKQLFFTPEYWVHEYVVPSPPPPPKSSYKPQSLEYDTVEGIVPVVGAFHCKNWLLVASANRGGLHATLAVMGMFDAGSVFTYYARYVGISPYFTWNGYLFKFAYTGYDAKTGKYRQGSQYTNTISICTDGLDVQKNPSGSATEYTVFSPGGSGGVLVVHQPRGTHGVGLGPKESSMESSVFGVRGLGKRANGDAAFNPALLRGLGRDPVGVGQPLAQFTAGGNGTVRMLPYAASAAPQVNDNDWAEFFPNDPDSFRPNTNLAMNASEQSSVIGGVSPFYGANPIGSAIVAQVQMTASSLTTYWNVIDPNHRAANTIGSGGNITGDGSSPGVAVIRSSYNAKGALKLEIALRVAPLRVDQFKGWPSKATVVSADSVPSNVDWAQEFGPVGGDLTSADMPGQTIALAPTGKDLNNIIGCYMQCISQPQYLQTIPSAAWGTWAGFGVARGGYLTTPTVYFTYGGQTYKVFWFGGWIAGQVGGAPNSGPSIGIAIITPTPKKVPPKTPPIFKAAPFHFPGGVLTPVTPVTPVVIPTAPVTSPSIPVPATTSAAIATSPPGMSPTMAVALGLIGAGVLGGVLYLVFE